jgi:dihydrofolate reductase
MTIAIIVAVSKNGVIGIDNHLPWHLPEDLKFFKNLTTSHTIIMGRKTHQSISKPLPNRKNIVITRQKEYTAHGCEIATSLENAIEIAKQKHSEKVFIIGGAEIYKLALQNTCQVLFVTFVDTEVVRNYYLRTLCHNKLFFRN